MSSASDSGAAALVVMLGYADMPEADFTDWYRLEHIPERMRMPGFVQLDRWFDPGRKLSLAWYGLESVGALRTPEYASGYGANFTPWTQRILAATNANLRYVGIEEYARDSGRDARNRSALALVEWGDRPDLDPAEGWAGAVPERWLSPLGVLDVHVYRVIDGPAPYIAVLGCYGDTTGPGDLAQAIAPAGQTAGGRARVTAFTVCDATVRGGPREVAPDEFPVSRDGTASTPPPPDNSSPSEPLEDVS